MYIEPATGFGAAGRLSEIPVTSVAEGASVTDDPARFVREALDHALQRRRARLGAYARDGSPGGEAGEVQTDGDQDAEDLRPVRNVVPIGVHRGPRVMLHALQEWEGYVVEINETEFTARLLDVTANASFEEEEADIPYAEIADDDRGKIQLGRIFRWVIGYERSAAGTKKRVSQIVFRDLPAVAKSDLQAAEAWALKMATAFKR